jgi:hypothetical protein
MFVVLVMFKPEGIAGIWQEIARRATARRSGATSAVSRAEG